MNPVSPTAFAKVARAIDNPLSACPDVQIYDVQWLLVQALAEELEGFSAEEAEYVAYRLIHGQWMTKQSALDSAQAATLIRGQSRTDRARRLAKLVGRLEKAESLTLFEARMRSVGLSV